MDRLDEEYLIIGDNAKIAPTVIFLMPERVQKENKIVIGNNVIIRDGVIIYGGVIIGDDVTIDHYCIIREGASIGDETRLVNFTVVNRDVKIGIDCKIGGLLANRSIVGDSTSCFGYILHNYPVHGSGLYEESPKIGDDVIVGRLAIIAGDVNIPSGIKIKAGQLITEKNIDSYLNKTNKKKL